MSEEPRQVVHSPEQVALHLPVAGPASRMLAYAIDYALIVLLFVVLIALLLLGFPAIIGLLADRFTALFQEGEGGLGRGAVVLYLALLVLLYSFVEIVYFVVSELTLSGGSLGKRVVGLRVVRDGGFPIGARESLVRNLLRVVDALPGTYVVGLVAAVISPEGKRLGDLAAGTIVVRLDRPLPAPPLPAPPPGSLRFRFDREQVGRLAAPELTLLRETLRRLDELSPGQVPAVRARVVGALCTRIGHPPVPPADEEAFLRALLSASEKR